MGHSVYAVNGSRSQLCFDRRFHPNVRTKAVINTQRLRAFLLRQVNGAATLKHAETLLQTATGQKHATNNATDNEQISSNILNSSAAHTGKDDSENNHTDDQTHPLYLELTATTEELLIYETEKTDDAFQTSIKAWRRMLQGWGVSRPDTVVIAERLKVNWGGRGKQAPHADVIYNAKEVKEVLFKDPRLHSYTWMWRD